MSTRNRNALMVMEQRYRPNATPVERALVKALRAERRRHRPKHKPAVQIIPPTQSSQPLLTITYTHERWSNEPLEPTPSRDFLTTLFRFLSR